MTPKERDDVWLKLEKEFRPWMDADDVPYLSKGTRWQYQNHIFESPFITSITALLRPSRSSFWKNRKKITTRRSRRILHMRRAAARTSSPILFALRG